MTALAGEIGERNLFRPGALARAADYLEAAWEAQGYAVTRQTFAALDRTCVNLEVERRGTQRPDESVVIGAHYDSVAGCPGANDNAMGVAALLELSAWWRERDPGRTLRFVAFANEESPFFGTEAMGSDVYARAARARGDDIRAMMSLEIIGYYSNAPGSQQYPRLLGFRRPDRGNFIAFVSNLRSRALLGRVVAAFRETSDFPAEHAAAPATTPGVSWSDQFAFWKQGYRAVTVTDTAPFRYPHYHSAEDLPERVDYPSLARVTAGLRGVLEDLAAR